MPAEKELQTGIEFTETEVWSDGDKLRRAGRRFQQQLPEYFPCKGRRTDWKKSFAYFSR